MKRMWTGLLMISLLCVFMTGCSDKASQTTNEPMTTQSSIDASSESEENVKQEDVVDLTVLSSTMIYSEVYNMMVTPEDYNGRTVKMKGQFAGYQDPENNKNYYAVIIADATACCQKGLEFVLAGDYKYPDDYPADGTEITVAGTFETYEEGGYKYCHLTDAKMTIDE